MIGLFYLSDKVGSACIVIKNGQDTFSTVEKWVGYIFSLEKHILGSRKMDMVLYPPKNA